MARNVRQAPVKKPRAEGLLDGDGGRDYIPIKRKKAEAEKKKTAKKSK